MTCPEIRTGIKFRCKIVTVVLYLKQLNKQCNKVAREWLESEGVRRNALRVKCPNSPHYEEKHEHRTKD